MVVSSPSDVVATFCGTLNATEIIDFQTEDFLTFTFDKGLVGKYNLTIRQISCKKSLEIFSRFGTEYDEDDIESCSRQNASEFLLQSLNYPQGYPNGQDYCTLIYPLSNNICFLQLRFDEFRLEASNQGDGDCLNDYLQISDESGDEAQRYCGTFAGIRLLEFRRPLIVSFVSNELINDVGYSIFAQQIECQVTTENPQGRSTSEEPLPDYQQPTTTTQSLIDSTTTITTTSLDPTMSNPFLTTTSTFSPPVIVEQSCLEQYSLVGVPNQLRITSPSYPRVSSQDCQYVINLQSARACSIQLEFHHFELGMSPPCTAYDYLALDYGAEKVKFCGSQTGRVHDFVLGQAAGQSVFRLDLNRASLWSGFDVTVRALPCYDSSGWRPVQSSTSRPWYWSTTRRPSYNPSTIRPSYNPSTIRPNYNPGTIRPNYNPGTIRPSYNPGTTRPNYNPSYKPNHHHRPGLGWCHFLFNPLQNLLREKVRLLRHFLNFGAKPVENPRPKPSYYLP